VEPDTVEHSSTEERPVIAVILRDGAWRIWGFIDHDGTLSPVSPNSSPEARDKQRSRHDRARARATGNAERP
jgi:hypothetical protein